MTENEIGRIVVDAAVAVHRELGPGLFESVYEVVFAYELEARSLTVRRQVPAPITYRCVHFDEGFRTAGNPHTEHEGCRRQLCQSAWASGNAAMRRSKVRVVRPSRW